MECWKGKCCVLWPYVIFSLVLEIKLKHILRLKTVKAYKLKLQNVWQMGLRHSDKMRSLYAIGPGALCKKPDYPLKPWVNKVFQLECIKAIPPIMFANVCARKNKSRSVFWIWRSSLVHIFFQATDSLLWLSRNTHLHHIVVHCSFMMCVYTYIYVYILYMYT